MSRSSVGVCSGACREVVVCWRARGRGRGWHSGPLSPCQTELLCHARCSLPREFNVGVPSHIPSRQVLLLEPERPSQPWLCGRGSKLCPIQFSHLKCPVPWLSSQYHDHHHGHPSTTVSFRLSSSPEKETPSPVAAAPRPSLSCWGLLIYHLSLRIWLF